MILKHKEGPLAYIKHKVTNALAKSLNAQIQYIKTCASGYRTFTGFGIAVLFFLDKLKLYQQEIS